MVDVGSGIGRVSQNLLLSFFERVSLLEACPKFMDEALRLLPAERVCETFPLRMGDFLASLSSIKFDAIWIQWVIIYSSDDELASFLRESTACLRPAGLIFLKDNVLENPDAEPIYDESDRSVTRSRSHLLEIFKVCGLEVIEEVKQKNMPKYLFPVVTFVLKPK